MYLIYITIAWIVTLLFFLMMAMDIHDFAAEIPERSLWFGAYPVTSGMMTALLDKGITAFLDLTTDKDMSILAEKYNCEERYSLPEHCIRIHVPIQDQRCPNIADAHIMVDWVRICLYEGHTVYIHCRGGHGRAALATGLVLMEYGEGMAARIALEKVNTAHQERFIMEPKWRTLGAPQTKAQKQFVLNWRKHTCGL